ncbi:hypothetical protein NKJ23_07355 [Mesorhizobium sp. M0184]|uniref:hypothetical protein n=1 Tax=Mesorhizobium sp. M0184 TaxID=2956906 RepID=UPI003335EFED
MTEKSAAELERDADIARARVADTADSIRSKMTPGQLIDEFTGIFSGEGSAMLTNLKTQVRDNPLPLTLVGAGLAWLMLGKGTSVDSSALGDYQTRREPDPARDFSDRRNLGGEGWQGRAATSTVPRAKIPESAPRSPMPLVRLLPLQAAPLKLWQTLRITPEKE